LTALSARLRSSSDVEADLVIRGVAARYGDAIEALQAVSLHVRHGEIFAIVGANGAGKTTLMRAISNLLPAQRGRMTRGSVRFEGHDVSRQSPGALVRLGLVPVLEGRHCFAGMSVQDNLVTGAIARGAGRAETRRDLDDVYTVFPHLADKRNVLAGQVSGGEQQMTAIGRALMARPRLLVLDEPSMGLAPLAVKSIFDALAVLNRDQELTILFSEQNARLARRYAHRIAVLTNGLSTEADGLNDRQMGALYFGE
jgi:branched-chain amino acid transport system ATP-binding protein